MIGDFLNICVKIRRSIFKLIFQSFFYNLKLGNLNSVYSWCVISFHALCELEKGLRNGAELSETQASRARKVSLT